MKITKEIVESVANLSRIKLDEAATVKMQTELGAVIDYMEILNSLDTKEIEPMSHIFSLNNVMRDDLIKPSIDRQEILSNAPDHTDETFVVPKTVG
ncbi:MAG: Asp-tRNA(Asn)/Glu-tRNA(Gln) amidotransferase subunit GatC [Clostridia bacterium]|nr:Asp-tRNA(Asn)/Glu-tRNA(Gln) amidotransferase subunit GatC [Clostridia bacterium]